MKKSLLTLISFLALAMSSHATIKLSETFSYGDGVLTSISGGLWSSHSGSGNGPVTVTNGQAKINFSAAEDINRALNDAPFLASDPSAKLYSSFTMIVSNTLPTTPGSYFAHFRGTNTSAATDFGGRIFLTRSNTITLAPVPEGKYRISIGNGSGATNHNNFGQIDLDLDTNRVYTVVTRFVPSTGLATIWVNPTSESDPSATANDTGTAVAPNPFNVFTYAFRQGGGGAIAFIDDLKIGTLFSDVAGANTAPLISTIPTQNTPMNTLTGPIPFTVSDAETPAISLTVSNLSSNPTLVPNGNIVRNDGDGTNRTLTITPVTGLQGSTTITVYVSDGVNTTSSSFILTVGAPTISAIPSQIIVSNTSSPAISFTVSDAESPVTALTNSSASSNPTLITTNHIVITGTGSTRTLTLTPEPDQTGISTITIFVTDGTNTTGTSFVLTVKPLLGVLLSDTFSYTIFSIPNGLYGAQDSPWQHASPTGLSFYELQVVNGAAELKSAQAEDLGAPLAGGPFSTTSGVVLYSGFTFNLTGLPTQGGNYISHFRDTPTGSGFHGKIFASLGGAAAGFFRLGLANTANSVIAEVPVDLSLNTTYSVITRYNVGTGETKLWVNATSESDTGVVATDNFAPVSIGAYGLRQDTGIGTNYIDNLIIGTSFSDVLTVVPLSPIPLAIQRTGTNVVLSWTSSGFFLQSSTNVLGVYSTISGANATSYTNPVVGPQMFFRLVHTNN